MLPWGRGEITWINPGSDVLLADMFVAARKAQRRVNGATAAGAPPFGNVP